MIWVTEAKYLNEYKIWLKFNTLENGTVDLKNTILTDLRPIFKELNNEQMFKLFHVEADTLVWDNDLDLATEFIYSQLQKQKNS